MESEFEGDGNHYNDVIAERVQAYVWLVDSLANMKESRQSLDLLKEGLAMLAAVRESITIPNKVILKAIRGDKPA